MKTSSTLNVNANRRVWAFGTLDSRALFGALIDLHSELREHIALRLLQCQCGNHRARINIGAEAVDKSVCRRNFDGLSQIMDLRAKINRPDITCHANIPVYVPFGSRPARFV